MKTLRLCTMGVCLLLLLASLPACGTDNANEPEEEWSSTSEGSAGESESTAPPEQEPAGNATGDAAGEPAEGTMRFHFTVSYLADDPKEAEALLEKSAIFSFDLPEEWGIEGTPFQNMLYDGGQFIGQIEMQPREATLDPLFSDVDAIWSDAVSTKEMTVSGQPAKCYTIESNAKDGEGTTYTYCYYIAPKSIDDAYAMIFFTADTVTEATEQDYETIVYSFILVA